MPTSLALVLFTLAAGCATTGDDNLPPELSATPLATGEDTPLDFSISAEDPEGEPLTFVGSAEHGRLEVIAGGFRYSPEPDFNGVDTITISASDGVVATELVLAIGVLAINDHPIAEPNWFSIGQDQALHLAKSQLLANDHDPDGDTLEVSAVRDVVGGQVTMGTAELVFVPDPGFTGAASFHYAASDGKSFVLSTVYIDVGGPATMGAPALATP